MLAVCIQKTIHLCRSGQRRNQALGQAGRLGERLEGARGGKSNIEQGMSKSEVEKRRRAIFPLRLSAPLRSLRLIPSKTEHRGEQVDFRTRYFWLEGKCRAG